MDAASTLNVVVAAMPAACCRAAMPGPPAIPAPASSPQRAAQAAFSDARLTAAQMKTTSRRAANRSALNCGARRYTAARCRARRPVRLGKQKLGRTRPTRPTASDPARLLRILPPTNGAA